MSIHILAQLEQNITTIIITLLIIIIQTKVITTITTAQEVIIAEEDKYRNNNSIKIFTSKRKKMNTVTRTAIKIVLTIVIILVITLINTAIMEARGRHATSGIGFIIFPAGIAAIIAVWKYKSGNNSDDQNLKKD